MWALLLLLHLHLAYGRDTQREYPLIKHVASCPDIGYYFERGAGVNLIEPQCHLCFCHNNGTAICWQRQNSRCDTKHYDHVKKRQTRLRRSPGFADIFFRDATRDILNKQTPEQCKPFESSFSEGCPPVDWCIGCTVCDCDANGRWDCHILSFCPNDKGNKKIKRKKTSFETIKEKRQSKKSRKTTNENTTLRKQNKNPPINTYKKSNTRPIQIKQENKNQGNSKQKYRKVINLRQYNDKQNKTMRTLHTKSITSAQPVQKKTIASKAKPSPKKDIQKVSKKPLTLNDSKYKNKPVNNATVMFAKNVLKKVMKSVEKIINKSQQNLTRQDNLTVGNNQQERKKKLKRNSKNNKSLNNSKRYPPSTISQKQNEKVTDKKYYYKSKSQSRKKRDIFVKSFLNTLSNESTTQLYSENTSTNINMYMATELFPMMETNKTLNEHIHTKYSNRVVESNKTIKPVTIKQSNITKTDNENVGMILIKDVGHINKYSSLLEVKNKSRTSTTIKNIGEKAYPQQNTENTPRGKVECGVKSYPKNLTLTSKEHNATNENFFNIFSNFRTYMKDILQSMRKRQKKRLKINEHSQMKKRRYTYNNRKITFTTCRQKSHCNLKHKNKSTVLIENDLRAESRKIMKSVQIIKGLLKLLSNGRNLDNNLSKGINNSDEIKQLKTILEGKEPNNNLTETQRIQIQYIKQNTKELIKSVQKFAIILNELLQKSNKKYEREPISLDELSKTKIKNETSIEKINKVKKILLEYNFVQNKFIKSLYNILNTLDQKVNSAHFPRVSYKTNKTLTEDIYSIKLLQTVRNLKNLEQKLIFKNRRKRYIEEDHAVNYFLMILEHLLKKNRPVVPINDGIDLIIEAIRNAPNITVLKRDNEMKSENKHDIIKHATDILTNETREDIGKPDGANETLIENNNSNISDISKDISVQEFDNITRLGTDADPTEPNYIYNRLDYKKIGNEIVSNHINDEDQKRFIVFDDSDEDLLTNNTVTEMYTIPINTDKAIAKLSFDTIDDRQEDDFNDNKTKLDWFDDSFDSELQELPITTTTTTTVTPTFATTTVKDKYANAISESQETEERNVTNEIIKYASNIFDSFDQGNE